VGNSSESIVVRGARARKIRDDSRKRAANTRAQARWAATQGRSSILTELDPPLYGTAFGAREVCDYLQCSYTALGSATRYNYTELVQLGYTPGGAGGRQNPAAYPARAVLHIALMMRPGSCARADAIKRALGMWVDPEPTAPKRAARPEPPHVQACQHLISRAFAVAEVVHDMDPADAWAEVEAMGRRELQAVAVTLAAFVQLDRGQKELRYYLTQVGKSTDLQPGEDASAAGLTVLVPAGFNDSPDIN
jgi:hypothetical protein